MKDIYDAVVLCEDRIAELTEKLLTTMKEEPTQVEGLALELTGVLNILGNLHDTNCKRLVE